MLAALGSALLCVTLFALPLVGVCVVTLAGGRAPGAGVQPAYLSLALLLVVLTAHSARRGAARLALPWTLVAALLWTLAGSAALWRLHEIGLAGETPWLKGSKQLLLLLWQVLAASAPALVLRSARDPEAELWRWERAATAGLALVCAYGLFQAVSFYREVPGALLLGKIASSNPSLASGSQELYLGHRFVGIPRVASTACEPLYFASYLLAIVPVTWAAALRSRRGGRVIRVCVAAAGTICFILTFARGAYFGAGVLLALLAAGAARGALPLPHGPRAALVVSAGVVLLIAVAATLAGVEPWKLPALLVRRVAQSFARDDLSNLTRLWAWRAAIAMLIAHPVAGVGWGGFGFWFYRLAQPGAEAAHFGWPTANSLPLLLACETGLVGLLLWCGAMWPAVRALVRPERRAASAGPGRAYLLAAVSAAVLAQTLTFYQIHLLHLAMLLGVSAAMAGVAPATEAGERLV